MPDTYLVSRTAADDVAFLALADLSRVLEGEEESGIIGGQMVSLLCARFPSPGAVARRTGDADGGIPLALARTAVVHDRLLVLGYTPTHSNRYEREGPEGGKRAVSIHAKSATLLHAESLCSAGFCETRCRFISPGGRSA